MPVFSDIIVAS